jgi:molybdate transport system substrate-binding protein
MAGLLEGKKLSMGDQDHVPAGIYGKQALQNLGVWDKVSPSVARSMDVRAALALVERKEAPLGVVYATDAAISKKVRIVGTFPENSHPKITYPAAIVSGKSNPTVAALLEFLRSDKARAIFQKNGFIVN